MQPCTMELTIHDGGHYSKKQLPHCEFDSRMPIRVILEDPELVQETQNSPRTSCQESWGPEVLKISKPEQDKKKACALKLVQKEQ